MEMIKEIVLRQEEEKDFEEICNLIKAAFETAEFSDGVEHDFVASLRKSSHYIPEFALIALEDKKIVGHVMLTQNFIYTETGKEECLLLAPLSVALEYRKKGIGSMLVNSALDIAKSKGFNAVLLCGDPDYYGRFGFISVSNYKITPLMDVPVRYVLVHELNSGWLKNIEGTINIV